jgi:uncharacterized protein YjbI with pentapeptide repeats
MRDEGILARVRTWSVPILLVIIALSITVSLQLRGESGTLPRRLTVVTVALLGVFLALGCLFAFPYAKIWQSRDGGNFELENGVRNILVGIVGGAFTLTTLYIGLESSRSALKSSEAAFREAMTNRLGQAGALIGDENAAVRASGLLALGRLMDDGDLNRREGYRILALYIKTQPQPRWTKKKAADWKRFRARWATMTAETRKRMDDSPRFGVGSLRKRAEDVQVALSVLGRQSKLRVPDAQGVESDYKADLRDADLRGAELGRAHLQRAIFSGAHLDYADCRTRDGHADLSGADFQGATLVGAWLNRANLTGTVFRTPVNADGSLRTEQRTDLSGAHLGGAVLTGTDFSHVDLTGARLEGADLSRTIGLDTAILTGATYDDRTRWPPYFWVPAGVEYLGGPPTLTA